MSFYDDHITKEQFKTAMVELAREHDVISKKLDHLLKQQQPQDRRYIFVGFSNLRRVIIPSKLREEKNHISIGESLLSLRKPTNPKKYIFSDYSRGYPRRKRCR